MSITLELYLRSEDIPLRNEPIVKAKVSYYKDVDILVSLTRFQKLNPDKDALVISKNSLRDGQTVPIMKVVFDNEDLRFMPQVSGLYDMLFNGAPDKTAETLSYELAELLGNARPDLYKEKAVHPNFVNFKAKLEKILHNCEVHRNALIKHY